MLPLFLLYFTQCFFPYKLCQKEMGQLQKLQDTFYLNKKGLNRQKITISHYCLFNVYQRYQTPILLTYSVRFCLTHGFPKSWLVCINLQGIQNQMFGVGNTAWLMLHNMQIYARHSHFVLQDAMQYLCMPSRLSDCHMQKECMISFFWGYCLIKIYSVY